MTHNVLPNINLAFLNYVQSIHFVHNLGINTVGKVLEHREDMRFFWALSFSGSDPVPHFHWITIKELSEMLAYNNLLIRCCKQTPKAPTAKDLSCLSMPLSNRGHVLIEKQVRTWKQALCCSCPTKVFYHQQTHHVIVWWHKNCMWYIYFWQWEFRLWSAGMW